MSSKPATSRDREEFPDIREELNGEDPARWLDKDVPPRRLRTRLVPHVRGMVNPKRVAAWLRVEHELDRGPRDEIVALLNSRRETLAERDAPVWSRKEIADERLEPQTSDDSPDREWSSASRRRETEPVGTGRVAQTPMSGSPPDGWTLPDGMDPVAPLPDDDNDAGAGEADRDDASNADDSLAVRDGTATQRRLADGGGRA